MRCRFSIVGLAATIAAVTASLPCALAADRRSVAEYVKAHPQLQLVSQSSDWPTYTAFGAIKLGRNLGIGTCATGEVLEQNLYSLAFAAPAPEACGDGWLSEACKAAWQNCVSTRDGILCDHSYLFQLYLLQQVVLSQAYADPAVARPALPTDAMLRMSRIASLSRAGTWPFGESKSLQEKYPWKARGPDDAIDRMLVEIGIIHAVILHELAHVEQAGCALGHADPRYSATRDLLEKISCRSLPAVEIRADFRALDLEAVSAREIQRMHKQEIVGKALYLRALMARLETAAMVLPNPEYAIAMYAGEPRDPSLVWDYYFDAGVRYPSYGGSGHIPPELRPVAALWMLNKRAFMEQDLNAFAFAASERLRPFLTGLLWNRCKRQTHAFGIRDALNLLMFQMDHKASHAASPSSKPPGYFNAVRPETAGRGGGRAPPSYPGSPGQSGAGDGPCDRVTARHAVDLGIRLGALLAAHVRGSKKDAQTSYLSASESARALDIDLPFSPDLPLSRMGEKDLDVSAGGFLFSVRLAQDLGESLALKRGKRVAAAFLFGFTSISAYALSADPRAREALLQSAAGAASVLNLPMEIVTETFRAVESGDAKSPARILRQLDMVVAHCGRATP